MYLWNDFDVFVLCCYFKGAIINLWWSDFWDFSSPLHHYNHHQTYEIDIQRLNSMPKCRQNSILLSLKKSKKSEILPQN
jgi:hypothetical protein